MRRLTFSWILFIAIALEVFVTSAINGGAMMEMVNVKTSLHLTVQQMQWVVLVFSLTTPIAILPLSHVCKLWGSLRIFTYSSILFTIGVIVAALSYNYWPLFIARILQGIASAGIYTASIVCINHYCFRTHRHHFLVLSVGLEGLGYAGGPIIGAVFAQIHIWQLLYWSALPLSLVAVICCLLIINKRKEFTHKLKLDWLGNIFIFISLTYAVIVALQGISWGWTSTAIVIGYIVAPIALILFIITELYVRDPLVHFSLLKNLKFDVYLILIFINYIFLNGVIYFYILYMLSNLTHGLTPLMVAVSLLPFTLTTFIMTVLCSNRHAKALAQFLVSIGCLMIFAGFICFWLTNNGSYQALWWKLFLVGVGVGIVASLALQKAATAAPHRHAATASAYINLGAYVGIIIGTAVGSVIYFHTLNINFKQQLQKLSLPASDSRDLISLIHSSRRVALKFSAKVQERYHIDVAHLADHSLQKAFHALNLYFFILAVVAVLLFSSYLMIQLGRRQRA